MKNVITGLLVIVFASSLFIGCDFVDSNSDTSVQLDQRTQVKNAFDGYYATEIDTTGRG